MVAKKRTVWHSITDFLWNGNGHSLQRGKPCRNTLASNSRYRKIVDEHGKSCNEDKDGIQ